MEQIQAQFDDGEFEVNAILTEVENGYLVEMVHDSLGTLTFHLRNKESHGGLSYELVEKSLPVTYEMIESFEYFINEDLSNKTKWFY